MPNFNIISLFGIFLGGILLTCISLLFVSPSSSLSLSLSLSPTTLPSFHSSSLSLSPPLPTWTQDNHPKARFSIKSVTHSHSHRAIRGIMHTKHSDAKLFFDSPVREISVRTHTHLYLWSAYNEQICTKTGKPCNAQILDSRQQHAHIVGFITIQLQTTLLFFSSCTGVDQLKQP